MEPGAGSVLRKTRVRSVRAQGELTPEDGQEYVTRYELDRYLSKINPGE